MVSHFLHGVIVSCAAAVSVWASEDFYVSRHAAKVLPHALVTLTTPESGEIRILAAAEGRLKADTPVAMLNEERLAIDEREAELGIRQQRNECNKNVLKLRKQKEELQFLQKLPPERRSFAQERLKTEVDEHLLSTIDEEIALAEERCQLSEDKSRQSMRKKREASTLSMPFDGRLQYHMTLPEDAVTVSVPAATPVATVIDDSAFYVVIPATDPSWSRLEHERLHLVVDLGGEKLRARWHHQKVDKGDRGESLFYYFLLPAEDNDRAFSLLGSNIVAELYYRCEDDWLYVSKSALAMEAGSRIIDTWQKLVDALRPGYRIVFIGETHLCLRKQDERADIPAAVPAP